ncbi:MBL fold metallo-hydrolase [Streptomyces sp. NPDC091972]|uniref:MBL fold metallo-hydrolase n=1 Tax=Streptomyces sp. NPDC091972 TaxID=3366007 RepID=UPI00381CA11A
MGHTEPHPTNAPADPTAVPGVIRLGSRAVNWYLIESPDGITLVDAGLPAQLGQLTDALARSGRTLGDVHSVLITHAHPDHTGVLGDLAKAGVKIWAHEQEKAVLADGPRSAMRTAAPERSFLPYLIRRPAAVGTFVAMARQGAFGARTVTDVQAFAEGQRLDGVPGRPQVLALPGHTPGSSGFFFPDLKVFFSGDALVTRDDLTGHVGPGLVCRGFTHDSSAATNSLDRIAALPQDTVLLPGHGEAFTGGPAVAADMAREFGVH